MKMVVAIMLIGIVMSLGSALFSMKRPNGNSTRMLRALTIRVVLSVGLVVSLIVSWKLGLIEPHVSG